MGSSNSRPVLRPEDRLLLASTSGLRQDQVEERFQAFLRDHPDGKLRPRDFRCSMVEALQRYKDRAEKLDPLLFRIYDANKDGVVDFVEFMVVLHCLQAGPAAEVIGHLFRVFDADRDGSISMGELRRLLRALLAIGWLEPRHPGEAGAEDAAATHREMDSDGDGRVTREEFVAAVLGQKVFRGNRRYFPWRYSEVFQNTLKL